MQNKSKSIPSPNKEDENELDCSESEKVRFFNQHTSDTYEEWFLKQVSRWLEKERRV